MRTAPLLLAASCLALTAACSSDESGAPATTIPSSVASSTASHSSSSPSSTSSGSATSTSRPVDSTAQSTAVKTTIPTTARVSTHTATQPTSTYTCHYEEGDAPCTASEHAANASAWASYQAQMNGEAVSPSTTTKPTKDVARDANGFALGGPPYPSLAAHPSTAQCLTYRDALVAWSTYQNEHRPAGSSNGLPMSGDVQNLWITCTLSYPSGG